MKYLYRENIETGYDGFESSEVLIFTIPDDFDYKHRLHELTIKYLHYCEYTFTFEEFYKEDDIQYYIYHVEHPNRKYTWTIQSSLFYILEYDNDERKKMLQWLSDNFKMKLIKAEII